MGCAAASPNDSADPSTPRDAIVSPSEPDESPAPGPKRGRNVEWLSTAPEDAAEMATLLYEAAPRLQLDRPAAPEPPARIRRTKSQQLGLALRLRIGVAEPLGATEQLNWHDLVAAVPYDQISSSTSPADERLAHQTSGDVVEVTSGGQVFFCLLQGLGEGRERCVVLKLVSQRLQCQSEQFANELARLVGVAVPWSRIVRQTSPDGEWARASASASALSTSWPDFEQALSRASSALVLEYIPGRSLFRSPGAFNGTKAAAATANDLGRIFALDMLLGNADRLPNAELGWRGNPGNVLLATGGRWTGRAVALDAQVQRRPPGGKQSSEDAACERLAELSLNFLEVAGNELREAARGASVPHPGVLHDESVELAFQAGVLDVLEALQSLQGLLEMMSERVSAWVAEFLADMEQEADRGGQWATSPARGAPRHTPPEDGNARGPPATPTTAPAAPVTVGGRAPPSPAANATATAERAPPSPVTAAHSPSPPAAAGPPTPGSQLGARDLHRTTAKIRALASESANGRAPSRRIARWEAVFRERSRELKEAVAGWQVRRRPGSLSAEPSASDDGGRTLSRTSSTSRGDLGWAPVSPGAPGRNPGAEAPAGSGGGHARVPSPTAGGPDDAAVTTPPPLPSADALSTGFLDGTRAIVDVYELGVRLAHSLNRARVLGASLRTSRPNRIEEGLYVGGAVAAASQHTLRHCGITHVLNATADLLPPEPGVFLAWKRIPLEDKEEEDLMPAIEVAGRFLDLARAVGGTALVHCHAGQSRSVSLILAWLMSRRHWTLARTLCYVRESHPEASPNAGYLACLLGLEERLIGTRSLRVRDTKPRLRACPECGKLVGLSREAVLVHTRLKHPPEVVERLRRQLSVESEASAAAPASLSHTPPHEPPASAATPPPSPTTARVGSHARGSTPPSTSYRRSVSPPSLPRFASQGSLPCVASAEAGEEEAPPASPRSHASLRSPRAHHAVIFGRPSRRNSVELASPDSAAPRALVWDDNASTTDARLRSELLTLRLDSIDLEKAWGNP